MGNWANNQAFVDSYVNEFLWETMKSLDIAATTPGPRELTYWPFYKTCLADGSIPIVSSNLLYTDGAPEAKPLGQTHLIIERNGIKVGLMALMGGTQFSSARIPPEADVRFQDPFERAPEVVAQLHEEGAEIVVLMSEMSSADTEKLLGQVPGIDLAFFGNMPPWAQDAEKIENTVVQKTGTRGQYLGQLTVIVDPEGRIIDYGAQNGPLLATTYGEDPNIAAKVEEVEAEMKKIREERVSSSHQPHQGTSGDE